MSQPTPEAQPDEEPAKGLPELEQLLLRCIEAPAAQQSEVLASLCHEHPALAPALRRRWRLLADVGLVDGVRSPEIEPEFGPYRVLRPHHGGETAGSYLAEVGDCGRRVVLMSPWPELLENPALGQRFSREARAWAAIDHPGIPKVDATGAIDGTPFLALVPVAGRPLETLLQEARDGGPQSGPLAWPGASTGREAPGAAALKVVAAFERLAAALQAAHAQGLVHRGLSPAEVLVDGSGAATVTGFIAPRAPGDGLPPPEDDDPLLGYRAPEQLVAEPQAGCEADVYALGAMLHECLGQGLEPPFAPGPGLVERVRTGRRQPLRLGRRTPAALADIVAMAMAARPDQRYATMADFAADLERIRRGEPARAPASGWVRRLLR